MSSLADCWSTRWEYVLKKKKKRVLFLPDETERLRLVSCPDFRQEKGEKKGRGNNHSVSFVLEVQQIVYYLRWWLFGPKCLWTSVSESDCRVSGIIPGFSTRTQIPSPLCSRAWRIPCQENLNHKMHKFFNLGVFFPFSVLLLRSSSPETTTFPTPFLPSV